MYDKIIIVAYKKNSRHLGHGPLKHRVIQNILACNKFKISFELFPFKHDYIRGLKCIHELTFL